MTFYELEKICKKKKIFRIISIFIFILIIIFMIIIFLDLFKFKNSKENIQVRKKYKITKKFNKKIEKKNVKYLPVIDLNITQVNLIPNDKIKKEKIKKLNTNKISKKNINKKSLILKAQNLPSFNTCIELSKKYFNNKDYNNALKWAKLANLQNRKDPVSWILAAKSLYKLGNKEKAIKLLKIYNSYYNNKEIKKLIKELNEK